MSAAPSPDRRPPAGAAARDTHVIDAGERIAGRLAWLRAERQMRISDLARRASVSPSLISQIERGQSRPSVTTLFALAQELEVPVDAFFESSPAEGAAEAAEPPPPGSPPVPSPAARPPSADAGTAERYVVRRGERPTVDIRGGVRWERLSRAALGPLEVMELVYQPGAQSDPQVYRHPGVECVLVVENRLDITIEREVSRLDAGDSIAFASTLRHRYENPTNRVTRAITAILRD